MLFFLSIVLALCCCLVDGEPLKQRLPFYHSSDEMSSLLEEAVHGCKTANARLEPRQSRSSSVTVDVVYITAKGSGPSKPNAVFVFGEHARELVSSESGLHFVQSLCGVGSTSSDKVQKALGLMDFIIIPNANPKGRSLVESGSFCKRTNENGVDLNRNWGDDHRDVSTMAIASADARAGADDDDAGDASEENPGIRGFSEPESEIVREVVEQASPKFFLSVHSGAYLLALPYGFTTSASPPNAEAMNQILSSISATYCGGQCPYGNLARTIGYLSPGCSVDYVTEHMKVPFAFTWEIWSDSTTTAQFAEDAKGNADVNSHKMSEWTSMAAKFQSEESGIRQGIQAQENQTDAGLQLPVTKAQAAKQAAQSDTSCLNRFNPHDEAELSGVLENWSEAYMDAASQVASLKAQTSSVTQSITVQDSNPAAHAESGEEWLHMMKTKSAISARSLAAVAPDTGEEDSQADTEEKFQPNVPNWNAMKSDYKWGFLTPKLSLAPGVAADDDGTGDADSATTSRAMQ
eukprot:gnl/MRDRNA2_/MRDRNA2_137850_c0_seq1.p1 gnl/MRDRNA2_/MRDRNA2_137850_c0~~gnl/MRDRNA2_/MRDRNA2_137850_c0_seq1.p1  ORF type:complete len:520 (+),score=107.95 gnl/MRDRNA2_/MRDRNA2_137850_c0_seq1:103-1662(+)